MQIKPVHEKTVQLNMPVGTATSSVQNVIQNLLNNRFVHGYDLIFKGRLAIGTAAGTAVNPEAPQNIFRRVRVEMQHNRFGKISPIDLPGATLYQRARLFNRVAPQIFGTAIAVGTGNYDIGVVCRLEFPLENVVESQEFRTLPNLLETSSVQIFLEMAPASDLVVPAGTTTFTWSAYGSAAGSPVVEVVRREVNGLSHNPLTDMVIKTDRIDSLNNAVALNNVNGLYLPRGADVRLIGLKQYVASANDINVVSAFLNPVLDTDNGIAIPQLLIGKKPIRDYDSWQSFVGETAQHFGVSPNSGYAIWDFVNRGNALDALAASLFAKDQNQYGYGGKINPAGANSYVEVFYDQILSSKQSNNA